MHLILFVWYIYLNISWKLQHSFFVTILERCWFNFGLILEALVCGAVELKSNVLYLTDINGMHKVLETVDYNNTIYLTSKHFSNMITYLLN